MASGERKPEQEGRSTDESQNERQEKTNDDEQTEPEPEPEPEPEEQKDDPLGHVYRLNNPNDIRRMSELLEKRWIDAQNDPRTVYLNYPDSESKCMSTSQRKFPTQTEPCNETDIKKGTDEINECLSQDNYNDSVSERNGDSFSHRETSMKAKTDSGKGQVFKRTPNDTRSGLHIDNSPKVQSRLRLSEQQMREIEQVVESILRWALDSFSDILMPHIAEQIRHSLRGKSPNNPEDSKDEKEDEEDE